jgi:hypothetical protein
MITSSAILRESSSRGVAKKTPQHMPDSFYDVSPLFVCCVCERERVVCVRLLVLI